MSNKTIGEKSNDTLIIESLIRKLEYGDVLTYDEISTALGRDVRKHCRSNLHSAMRACERDGIILGTIINEGYRRLDDVGIVDAASADTKAVGRRSRRALKKLSHVNFNQLPNDLKIKHTAKAAQLGALEMFSKGATTKKLEDKAGKAGSATLAIGETLKLFTD